MEISGSAAIVTGGASGLGAATAQALVARGAIVTLIDLNAEAGDSKATDLGGGTRFVRADVTDPEAVEEAVSLACETAPLRIAINCAGIAIGSRTIDREGSPALAVDGADVRNGATGATATSGARVYVVAS